MKSKICFYATLILLAKKKLVHLRNHQILLCEKWLMNRLVLFANDEYSHKEMHLHIKSNMLFHTKNGSILKRPKKCGVKQNACVHKRF